MQRSFRSIAAVLLVALVLAAGVFLFKARNAGVQASKQVVVHVVEHAITDTVVDIGPKGDSRGDLLAFANPVFDPVDKHQVGSDSGNCVRTIPGKLYECNWTVFLAGDRLPLKGHTMIVAPTHSYRLSGAPARTGMLTGR